MELYRETAESVNLAIYISGVLTDADSAPTVTITRLSDDTVIVLDQVATQSGIGKYYFIINTNFTSLIGKFKVEWTYIVAAESNIKTDYYDVVVGYANAQQFRDAYPALATKTNEEIYAKEKLARKIIDVYANQDFSFQADLTITRRGSDKNRLFLDKRIYNFTQVQVGNPLSSLEDITAELEIWDDYWISPTIDFEPSFFPDIKRGLFEPGRYFRHQLNYYVTGDFGWESVPDGINLAALILMNDYFCDDTMLRDHGVIMTQLGDRVTRISADLLGTTGNYTVDMLLSEFTYLDARLI